MPDTFHRESLPAQLARHLEDCLRDGRLRVPLPGERVLSETFRVSRNTLRAALLLLRGRGGTAKFDSRPRAGRVGGEPAAPPRTIALLRGQSLSQTMSQDLLLFSAIEHDLSQAGYALEQTFVPRQGARALRDWARARVAPGLHAAWALGSVPRDVQQRAADVQVPTLVIGSCFPGIRLPELDVDYRAVCRHAAQHLLRLRYPSLVLVTPRRPFAGDRLSNQGFSEAADQARDRGVAVDTLYHGDAPESLRPILDRLLHRRRPPLAFLVVRPGMAMALVSGLLRRGVSIPDQAAVIARDRDPLFAWHVPPIAGYVTDITLYARRGARALLRLAEIGHLEAPLAPLMPRLISGGTFPAQAASRGTSLPAPES